MSRSVSGTGGDVLAQPLNVVAHHEFLLLISSAQQSSLPGVMSFFLDQAIDGPGAATRQVRGHHRIMVIRRTGTTQDGNAAACA
jgi:hypothetical protein